MLPNGNIWLRLMFPLCITVAACYATGEARCEEWMFRRSYFSHAEPPLCYQTFPPPRSQSAYRPAIRGSGIGFGIRGGFRYNSVILRSGRSIDRTVIVEDWFDVSP